MWKFLSVFILAVAISNGESDLDKKITKAPYQVTIIKDDRFICGGTIISKNWLITAAHCLSEPMNAYKIRAGSSYQKTGGSVHTINKAIPQDDYSKDKYGLALNDLVLVKVNEPFVLDDTRKPIDLFGENDKIPEGYNAGIIGWSYSITQNAIYFNTFNIPVLPRTKCNELYSIVGGIKEYQVCAGLEGHCNGYFGGPLIVNGRLAAINSWTNACPTQGYYDVYIKISDYRGWIRSTTGV